MQVKLVFLASLRDSLNCPEEAVHLPDSVRTIADLTQWLHQRGGAWQTHLSPPKLWRVAQNQVLVGSATVLEDGAEIAFLPPVTGG